MNKSISILTLLAFLAAGIISSCNSSPNSRVRNAEENVTEANEALDRANEAYVEDMRNYRMQTNERIRDNNQRIEDFRAQIANEDASNKTKYQKQIEDLKVRNGKLKERLDNYDEEGKDNWEQFKLSFNREMDRLGDSFNEFSLTSND